MLGYNPKQVDLREAVEALEPMSAAAQLLAAQISIAPAAEAAAEVDALEDALEAMEEAMEEASAHPDAPPPRSSSRQNADDDPSSPGGDSF
jgi:hypothetical protein